MFTEANYSSSDEFRKPGTSNSYDPRFAYTASAEGYRDELGVVCPSHTTERRLVSKVDLRVIPILSKRILGPISVCCVVNLHPQAFCTC